MYAVEQKSVMHAKQRKICSSGAISAVRYDKDSALVSRLNLNFADILLTAVAAYR